MTLADGTIAPRTVTCPMCGAPVPATDSVCRNCGGRMGVLGGADADRRPPSASARKSAIFGAVPFAIQLLSVGILIAVTFGPLDVDNILTSLAVLGLVLFVLPVIGGGAAVTFTVFAIIFGIRGIRETANGMTRGRWLAVLGLVLAGIAVIQAIVSIVGFIVVIVSEV